MQRIIASILSISNQFKRDEKMVKNLCGLLALAWCALAYAGDAAQDTFNLDYKLTLSHYVAQQFRADDVNLRASHDNQTGWIGFYKENTSSFEQVRLGYERTDRLPYTKLVSSLQAADHGFWGGALTAEIGTTVYAILGYGRTNLGPYDNINFDPNDAITYGIGWHVDDDFNISLYAVRDNRVVPGQQITHLLVRKPLPNDQTIVVDVFSKNGPNDDQNQPIDAVGLGITYDWPKYFVRLTYDPKVNFSQQDMTRISAGLRF
jgi:hypothetical protein